MSLIFSETLSLNRELSQLQAITNTAIRDSETIVSNNVNNDISKMNDDVEVKSKKA